MYLNKNIVAQIFFKYKTTNVYFLAEELDLHILTLKLGNNINAYRDNNVIVLNSYLTEEEKIFQIAHEIGHCILHEGVNLGLYITNKHINIGCKEREADLFAIELLMYEKEGDIKDFSYDQLCKYCYIPQDIFEQYMYMLKNFNFETNIHSY